MTVEKTMDKIVALCKNRGFVYPGSEIYGGLANAWDYGPLGAELKNNVKRMWWKRFIQEHPYNVGLDCAILMNPQVWVASGHVGGFTDPLVDCKSCKTRHRADNLINDWATASQVSIRVDGWTPEQLSGYIREKQIPCPSCGDTRLTDVRKFNMMFKTFQGVTEDSKSEIYLRPETAQGMFVNFKNVQRTTRKKIPFGIGQIGKSFRNEITPGNFTFRTREFEQMELEFFCEPGTDLQWFAYWKQFCINWLKDLGLSEQNTRLRDHDAEELSFYSNATTDIEYLFPFGWGELWGIADRTDYDLKRHMEQSKEDLSYFDPNTNAKFIPYCIEPALGADRVVLAFLCDAYDEEEIAPGDVRTVLRFHPALAPVKAAVLPLSKKLGDEAWKVYEALKRDFNCEFDETGSIGKRYRRQDEIGTPYCITLDFDSLVDRCVTIRERDSMEQVRVPIDFLKDWFAGKLELKPMEMQTCP
ncbi:MAG TPA: glycine--tRNA ligase [Clostridiales bacterium]|nr:glycine--tRNA ligase [Clostridiales bacterium]